MRNLIMTLVMLIGINVVYAQERQRGGFNSEERAKAQVERLEKELKLTKEQKDGVQKILLDQSKEQQALFQNAGEDREKMREQMTALRTKADGKIILLLDDKQKEKYKEIQKESANRGPGGQGQRGGNRGAGGPRDN